MKKTELLFKNSTYPPKQFCSSPVILYDIDLISNNLLHHKTNMQRKNSTSTSISNQTTPVQRPFPTWSLSRLSVATTMHSFSCGGGQSELPSMPSLTCRRSKSNCSKLMGQTSTTKGTRFPTDHSELEDQAKLWKQANGNWSVSRSLLTLWDQQWWYLTCPGPQEIPTMCLELSPGRALGCFLLEKSVSKCCSLSLLPQLSTSPSSVRAKQCVDPTATSTTFFPDCKQHVCCCFFVFLVFLNKLLKINVKVKLTHPVNYQAALGIEHAHRCRDQGAGCLPSPRCTPGHLWWGLLKTGFRSTPLLCPDPAASPPAWVSYSRHCLLGPVYHNLHHPRTTPDLW